MKRRSNQPDDVLFCTMITIYVLYYYLGNRRVLCVFALVFSVIMSIFTLFALVLKEYSNLWRLYSESARRAASSAYQTAWKNIFPILNSAVLGRFYIFLSTVKLNIRGLSESPYPCVYLYFYCCYMSYPDVCSALGVGMVY